jgi:hypothetical protein
MKAEVDMSTKDVLVRAKELISDPARWTKGAMARDADGHPCDERDPDAKCFCAYGAVRRFDTKDLQAISFLHYATREVSGFGCAMFVDEFNDMQSTTHAKILQVFDKAITTCDS